ncbi:uncharacterized protein STEHIDRAFT_114294 [Stereum hirsutum FP-91666 SS1]|uniref:uncharacterized protein n=1 Tax=Stereum hirsutum (strain FP-91666) TaxID=721885 RepID=UPI000444A0A9|nr:uncharacterized protein STEHIDRAFT_114294 [Stereum hirsutum FP-91666 SS1]EIM82366.1 hypothetical protein STEHIDRAFT_114294 [Stereum hirsutum FP-91666 SS1]
MVDWQDPETIRAQHESLVKLCYFLDGMLVWEFLVALPFDLKLLRNGRATHFAPMVYMLCRFMTLSTALAQVTGFSLQSDFDCQVFSYCSLGTASLLIVLRGLFPSLFMVAVWLVNIAFLIRSLAIGSQSEWDPTADACVFPKSNSARDSIISLLVTDTVLLCTVLAGLLRMKNSGGLWNSISNWGTSFNQGIVWITIAITFGIPGAVFIVLDLNGSKR